MTPAMTNLLASLGALGIELQSGGDMIRYRPRQAMTPALLEQVRTHKLEMFAWLLVQQARTLGDADLAEAMEEAWQERLSIQSEKAGAVTADQGRDALNQLRTMLDTAMREGAKGGER